MQNKFASNLFILLFANLLVKPFWIFGIDRVVQNRVGVEAYGSYFALFNLSMLFSIVLDFGINNFNNRAIARHPSRLSAYLPNLLLIKLGLAGVYILVAMFVAFISGYQSVQVKLLLALAFNQVILSYILYLRSNLTALHHFKLDSFISILDRLLSIIICGVLLYSTIVPIASFRLHYFILAQSAALLLTAIIAGIALKGKTPIVLNWWRWRFVKAILARALPFALLGLLMTIYYRIDAIMLERMYGAAETGIYAKAYRLLDAINQFGYLFGIPLLPLFATMLRRREPVQDLLQFSAVLMFLFATSAAILCSFFGSQIMTLLYPDADLYSMRIFSLLMISFIPISSVYIFGTLLTAHGSMLILNCIAVGGIIINIVLNLLWIPDYGAMGTTFATLCTQLVVAGLHIMVANRSFEIKWHMSLLLRLGGFVVGAVGLSWWLTHIHGSWLLRLTADGVGIIVLIFALQLVTVKKLSSMWTGHSENT